MAKTKQTPEEEVQDTPVVETPAPDPKYDRPEGTPADPDKL